MGNNILDAQLLKGYLLVAVTGLALLYAISTFAIHERSSWQQSHTKIRLVSMPANIRIGNDPSNSDGSGTVSSVKLSSLYGGGDSGCVVDNSWRHWCASSSMPLESKGRLFWVISDLHEGLKQDVIGWRPSVVHEMPLPNNLSGRPGILGKLVILNSIQLFRSILFGRKPDHGALIEHKLFFSLLQRCRTCFSRVTLAFLGEEQGLLRSIRRLLRDTGLPNSHGQSTKGAEYQEECEPSKSPVRFDLISLELAIFALACLAFDLFFTFWFIDKNAPSFKMQGAIIVVVFLIGQGAVYLLCCRLEAL
jgi:hypothetical protein